MVLWTIAYRVFAYDSYGKKTSMSQLFSEFRRSYIYRNKDVPKSATRLRWFNAFRTHHIMNRRLMGLP